MVVGETRNEHEAKHGIASDNSVPTVNKLPALMDYMVRNLNFITKVLVQIVFSLVTEIPLP